MIIYKTTNLINNKIYIGQSRKNNTNYYGSGKLIKNAIKKYGKDNFIKEILTECLTLDDLNEKEIYWIDFYNSTNLDIGYNIEKGGSSVDVIKYKKTYVFTDEHRNNISLGNKNKPKSKKHCKSISLSHANVSGENNPMFNRNHSDESKLKISENKKNIKPSKETKILMSKKTSGELNSNSKLTKNQVIYIRDLYFNKKYSQNILAKMFEVNQPCIYKIVNYKTWKNIV